MSGRAELPSGLVTFMFTDIEGSTRMARMLGEDYGTVLGDHRELLRAAVRDFGGVELLTEGDSFFLAFREAGAALASAVEAQRRLSAHEWALLDTAPRVRMGMHTGWAKPLDDGYASVEVHRAARVAAAAHGGQILCSGATVEAASHERVHEGRVNLKDLGPHRLRGFDDDEQIFQVVAEGLEQDFPSPRTPAAARHNLPAAITSFVGRCAERNELASLLGRHRMVTIAGGGGAGKTALSFAVAEQVLPAYPDGVWNVEAGDDTAVAAALGVRAEPGRSMVETLVEHCSRRRMLLVLQTCDRVLSRTAGLARRLLGAAAGLDVLTTSRAPLGVPGEVVWRIPPLSGADAVRLLAERTAAARGEQAGDDAELAGVAARLEGSPLAVELAAKRLRLLSAAQLTARLDDPISALDPAWQDAGRLGSKSKAERHHSLTASLDWSYDTLTAPGASLLRRLAVFAGPVDLGTVEWCGADALGALSELADKSLIDVVPGHRYRMDAQVRAYAARRLHTAGDERTARDRHLCWSLHTLAGVALDTDGQPRTVSLTEFSPYVDEWQAALRWAAHGGDVAAGLRLAGALDPWWREYGGAREGRDLLFRLYHRSEDAGVSAPELAAAYLTHAGLAEDRAERTLFLERAEHIALAEDNPFLRVRALAGRRATLVEAGRFAEAEQLCRDVTALAERSGVPDAALPAVITLAELLWRRNALDEAADLLGSARQLEAGRPEDRGRRTVDWMLGMVALRRRDLVAAHDHLAVALRSRLRHGFRGGAADAIAAIAVRCAAVGDQMRGGDPATATTEHVRGDPATAAVLFGGAEAARGARRTELFGRFWSAEQSSLRTALGDAAFDEAYAVGMGLGFDRIVGMALAVEHPDLQDGAVRLAQTLT